MNVVCFHIGVIVSYILVYCPFLPRDLNQSRKSLRTEDGFSCVCELPADPEIVAILGPPTIKEDGRHAWNFPNELRLNAVPNDGCGLFLSRPPDPLEQRQLSVKEARYIFKVLVRHVDDAPTRTYYETVARKFDSATEAASLIRRVLDNGGRFSDSPN